MVVYPLQELVYVHQLLQSLLLLVIFFGRGGAPLASIKLGEKNPKEAERILGNAFSSLILTSLIIMFCLLVWGDKILILFGASQKHFLMLYLI